MDKKSLKIGSDFGFRLNAALRDAGIANGPTDFARQFNLRAGDHRVTIHGARKWLQGESFPGHERLLILANWLKVSPQWLRFGEGVGVASTVAAESELVPIEQQILQGVRGLPAEAQAVVFDLVRSLARNYPLQK